MGTRTARIRGVTCENAPEGGMWACVHAVTLVGSAGSVVHTTPLTTTQAGIVAACQVPAPAVVTALDPV